METALCLWPSSSCNGSGDEHHKLKPLTEAETKPRSKRAAKAPLGLLNKQLKRGVSITEFKQLRLQEMRSKFTRTDRSLVLALDPAQHFPFTFPIVEPKTDIANSPWQGTVSQTAVGYLQLPPKAKGCFPIPCNRISVGSWHWRRGFIAGAGVRRLVQSRRWWQKSSFQAKRWCLSNQWEACTCANVSEVILRSDFEKIVCVFLSLIRIDRVVSFSISFF